MKVVVPIDVESREATAAAIDAILDTAWPDDVEFHLLNVIETEQPGMPCEKPECEMRCRCLEPRVGAIGNVMRRLMILLPGVPIYVEVAKGNLEDKIAALVTELDDNVRVLTPKPIRKRPHHHAAAAIAAISVALATLLVGVNAAPAGAFAVVPPMVPPRPPAIMNVIPQPAQPTHPRANEDELRMQVFSQLGDANVDADEYGKAATYYKQALKYCYKAHASQAKLSSIAGGLSIAYCGLGEMDDAIRYGKVSVNAALAAKPRDMTDISIAYNNLAYLLKKHGSLAQTEMMYEKSLVYAPNSTLEERVRAATIEANLAEVYGINKKLDKALAAYKHSLAVLKRELPAEHPVIKELEEKLRYLQIHHKVVISKYPMSVTFLNAHI